MPLPDFRWHSCCAISWGWRRCGRRRFGAIAIVRGDLMGMAGAIFESKTYNDPSMDWSRYDPVDPKKFDVDVYGGRKRKP